MEGLQLHVEAFFLKKQAQKILFLFPDVLSYALAASQRGKQEVVFRVVEKIALYYYSILSVDKPGKNGLPITVCQKMRQVLCR